MGQTKRLKEINVRPADLLVKKWNGDRDLCIDVTVISPFTRHGPDSNALSTAVSRKNEKQRSIGGPATVMDSTSSPSVPQPSATFMLMASSFWTGWEGASRDRQLLGDGKDCATFKDWLVLSIQTGVAKQLVARSSFF